ncbi:MAG: carbon-nitrogen hydrolase family protein [Kiritimatiellae bacterium]|nr:carbon-nitrogen hydrolase family protein [Kiritimatiellia bacterium]
MKRSHLIALLFLLLPVVAIGLVVIVEHAGRGDFEQSRRGHVRVALCQYGTRLVDREWNFRNAMREAEAAIRADADVIVFPEFSFLSAYELKVGRGWENLEDQTNWVRRIRSFTRRHGVYLFVNHPAIVAEAGTTNRYNQTQVFGPDGSVVATYRKRVLSTMDMFFRMEKGEEPTIVDLPFGKVGLMICKDSTRMDKFRQYAYADLVLVQYAYVTFWGASRLKSAGFGEPSEKSLSTFPRLMTNGIHHIRRPMLLCNKSGLEGECLYNGSSAIVDAAGRIVARADTGPGILYADIPVDKAGKMAGPPVPTRFSATPMPLQRKIRHGWNWFLECIP